MNSASFGSLGLIALLGVGFSSALQAQTAPAPAAPTSRSSGTDVLEEVVVTGVRLEDQVSPLQRHVSSVLGLELSVLDTPRAVTEINLAQVRDQSIITVEDFAKIVSNAYTNDQFGGANVPFLRGQAAEVFQNGVLRTSRSDGQPLSFNSVEGFDIIKGPANVVYGPTGNVGGYVNLVTKRPFFDTEHVSSTLTYGEYNERKFQLDVSGPLTDTLAYRVSAEEIHDGSYYLNGFQHSSDIYAAIRFLPTDKLTVDFNTEYFIGHYTENTGINRPTQQLIDSGLYYTGTAVSPYAGPGDTRGFDGVIDVTGAVPINRSLQLVADGDHDHGTNVQLQLDVTYKLNDTFTLAEKGYFEDYSQLQIEYAQRYYNNIAESYNFEDRIELRGKWSDNQMITGASYRFIHVLAYGDYYNEYLNDTDITTNPANFQIVDNLFGVLPVPGSPTQFATPGASYNSELYPNAIPNTQNQTSYQVGVFFQDIYDITDQLSVLGGLRADVLHESLTDPLPPPGFTPAHATATDGEAAVDVSVTYKPVKWNTTYVTADFNESPVTTNGGGFDSFTGDSILGSDFHIKNYLYEAGTKFALLDNTLFLSNAIFYQQRANTDEFGNTVKVKSYGFEAEANYQPNNNFSATAAYGYLNAKYIGAYGPLAFTENVYDAFAPPYGTGVGSPNFDPLPLGNYRVPAVPNQIVSAFSKYRFNSGFGASVGLVATGPMTTSYLGNVMIHSQYQLDGSLFYEQEHWAAHLYLYNLTNQKNWVGEAGPQGNDLITAVMPFHVMGTVSVKF